MSSIAGKLIAVILAFALLAVAPIMIVIMSQNIRTERVTWNSLTDFTDIVSDKGLLDSKDYYELVAKLGATSVDYDVTITVQRKYVTPGESGYQAEYVPFGVWKSSTGGVDDITYLEAGDIVQVRLEPMSLTQGDNLLRSMLGLYVVRQPYVYAANVRNDGGLT
jgi:hypothetical protein